MQQNTHLNTPYEAGRSPWMQHCMILKQGEYIASYTTQDLGFFCLHSFAFVDIL